MITIGDNVNAISLSNLMSKVGNAFQPIRHIKTQILMKLKTLSEQFLNQVSSSITVLIRVLSLTKSVNHVFNVLYHQNITILILKNVNNVIRTCNSVLLKRNVFNLL